MPILTDPTATEVSNGGGALAVVASKTTGSAPGDLTIKLVTNNTTNATLLTKGALKYAACIGTCQATNLSQETYKGTVSATGELNIIPTTPLTASPTTYNIYFWLDSASVDTTIVDATYSGYISASAIQVDSRTQ